MTITEAAASIGKSEVTLRRWVKSGFINAIKIGGTLDISESEVNRVKAGEPNGERPGFTVVSK